MQRKLIAFDNSALQRLWDTPSQLRIIAEAAGVRETIKLIDAGVHDFLLTWPLVKEIEMAPAADMTYRALGVLPDHLRYAGITDLTASFAKTLAAQRLRQFDALHVACACLGGAHVLLTVDSAMLKFGNRHANLIGGLAIVNPADFKEIL
jgi:hypothetical protein